MLSVDPTSDPVPFFVDMHSGEIIAAMELHRENITDYTIVIEVSFIKIGGGG